MMAPQGLQISTPEDSLAQLGIITNGIVIVNIVFRVGIAGCRRLPVLVQPGTHLFFWHGLLKLRFSFHVHPACGIFSEIRGQGLSSNAATRARFFLVVLDTFSQLLSGCKPKREGRNFHYNYVAWS